MNFYIEDMGKLRWELKRYALFHNTTMRKVAIEAVKDKIGFEEKEDEE